MTTTPDPEDEREGITHTGPETLNITGRLFGAGARIGTGAVPPRPVPRIAPSGISADNHNSQVNNGIQNLGSGQVTAVNCLTGVGPTLYIGMDQPDAAPEPEPGPEPELEAEL